MNLIEFEGDYFNATEILAVISYDKDENSKYPVDIHIRGIAEPFEYGFKSEEEAKQEVQKIARQALVLLQLNRPK